MKRIFGMYSDQARTALTNLRHCRSEIVARALIAYGIIGKPLCACGKGLYWAFQAPDGTDPLETATPVKMPADAPWIPIYIKEPAWRKALKAFRTGDHSCQLSLMCFADSVSNVLMANVYAFASFTREISIVDILLPNSVLGTPVRRRGEKEYYFDNNRVYRSRDVEGENWTLDEHIAKRVDCRVWSKVAASWEEGMSASKCLETYLNGSINYDTMTYSFLERLCTKIDKPAFERSAGFPRCDGYDRIRVTVCLNSSLFPSYGELIACVKEHRKEIDKMVAVRVREATEQKTDSVPLSKFKLTGIHAALDYTIDYVFERIPDTQVMCNEPHGQKMHLEGR